MDLGLEAKQTQENVIDNVSIKQEVIEPFNESLEKSVCVLVKKELDVETKVNEKTEGNVEKDMDNISKKEMDMNVKGNANGYANIKNDDHEKKEQITEDFFKKHLEPADYEELKPLVNGKGLAISLTKVSRSQRFRLHNICGAINLKTQSFGNGNIKDMSITRPVDYGWDPVMESKIQMVYWNLSHPPKKRRRRPERQIHKTDCDKCGVPFFFTDRDWEDDYIYCEACGENAKPE